MLNTVVNQYYPTVPTLEIRSSVQLSGREAANAYFKLTAPKLRRRTL